MRGNLHRSLLRSDNDRCSSSLVCKSICSGIQLIVANIRCGTKSQRVSPIIGPDVLLSEGFLSFRGARRRNREKPTDLHRSSVYRTGSRPDANSARATFWA